MHFLRLSLFILGLLPTMAFADWFYAAVKITCDPSRDRFMIINASAYNEAGIRKPDERQGVYIPQRNWPRDKGVLAVKEHRCKTQSAEFQVLISPVFANTEAGDTLAVAVMRNGISVLKFTSLDDDPAGLRPDSYVTSITVPAAGEPIVARSCQAKVHMGHLGIKCSGEGPNSMERTR